LPSAVDTPVPRMKRLLLIVLLVATAFLAWRLSQEPVPLRDAGPTAPVIPRHVEAKAVTASEKLLDGYGDPATPPVEDLKKIQRVIAGYFSVVKDASRFPIGGNADLAAALRGENANKEAFVPEGHPVFSNDGLLIDRWRSPLVVHPEGWKQIELRSPGPDRQPHTGDDIILAPGGMRR
jgi:hypothetical protein